MSDHRILAYHAVVDLPYVLPAGINCAPARFAAHLEAASAAGFVFRRLDEAVEPLIGGGAVAGATVALTFDDGYEDNAVNAFPLLQARNIPCCMFVSTDFIGGAWPNPREPSRPLRGLSRATLLSLHRSGLVSFGSHGRSHQDLTTLTADRRRAELVDSKKALEDLLGAPVEWLSYPFGSFDEALMDLAREAGYRAAFSVWQTRFQSRFCLNRIPLHGRDGLVSFRFKLSRAYFPMKRLLASRRGSGGGG